MTEDEKWMIFALEEARMAEKEGEVPVGAILVKDKIVVARAHNKPISENDPTAHAEIRLLRAAGSELKNYRLPGTTLYVTLEPCAMCLGAIMQARIKRIVFGAYDPKSGVCGSSENFIEARCLNHKIDITCGVLEHESKQLLKNFFNSLR